MSKAEKFIKDYTRNCSNEMESPLYANPKLNFYPWLTPEEARKVADIAREETIKEVCEWLDNHTILSEKWYIEDLKKHFEDKV